MRPRNFFQADSSINALFFLVGPRNCWENGCCLLRVYLHESVDSQNCDDLVESLRSNNLRLIVSSEHPWQRLHSMVQRFRASYPVGASSLLRWDCFSFFSIFFLSLVVVSTHLKNMLVKLDHFPRDRGENKKYLVNHHLVSLCRRLNFRTFGAQGLSGRHKLLNETWFPENFNKTRCVPKKVSFLFFFDLQKR